MAPLEKNSFEKEGTEIIDAKSCNFPFLKFKELCINNDLKFENHVPDLLYRGNNSGKSSLSDFNFERIRLVSNGRVENFKVDSSSFKLAQLAISMPVQLLFSQIAQCPPEKLQITDVQLIRLGPNQYIGLHDHSYFDLAAALCIKADRSSYHIYQKGPSTNGVTKKHKLKEGEMILHRGYRKHGVTRADKNRLSLAWLMKPNKSYFPAGMAQKLYSPFI